jgi:hypothetical protein
LSERCEALLKLARRKRLQIAKLAIDLRALHWKCVVILNHFAQKAGQKRERKLTQKRKMVRREGTGLRGILRELRRIEILGQHGSQSSS